MTARIQFATALFAMVVGAGCNPFVVQGEPLVPIDVWNRTNASIDVEFLPIASGQCYQVGAAMVAYVWDTNPGADTMVRFYADDGSLMQSLTLSGGALLVITDQSVDTVVPLLKRLPDGSSVWDLPQFPEINGQVPPQEHSLKDESGCTGHP